LTLRAVAAFALLAAASGCRSVVLSEYGTRVAVVRNDDGSALGREFRNRGVDFKLWAVGDPIIAAADGIVREVEYDECAGYEVLIEHPGFARHTFYIHLAEPVVAPGQTVKRGEILGPVALPRCSGKVIHVHMELLLPPDQVPPGSTDVLAGTENPLAHSAGCFDARKRYPTNRLVLTYPVRC
jgi:murein DD-endopeptidase MepM/ murein hydrolase activator NlpD